MFSDGIIAMCLTFIKVLDNCCSGSSVGSYSASYGIDMIRRHVADYIECRDGYKANHENICLCAGASTGIKNVLQMLINEVNGKDSGQ